MTDQQGPKHHPKDDDILERSTNQQQQLREHILSQPADKYAGKPWDLVADIEKVATEIRLPMIFRSEKIAVSKTALSALSPAPKVFVEFGTFVGTSAIAWAALLRDLHGPTAEGLHVFSFEYDPQVAAVARDLVQAAGVDDIVEVLVGPGADSLRRLHAEGRVPAGGVDAVFIDHFEQYYLPDLKLCEELGLFHPGSLVLADNTDMPGAPDYLAHVRKGGEGPVKYETRSISSGATRGPIIVEVSKVVAV